MNAKLAFLEIKNYGESNAIDFFSHPTCRFRDTADLSRVRFYLVKLASISETACGRIVASSNARY